MDVPFELFSILNPEAGKSTKLCSKMVPLATDYSFYAVLLQVSNLKRLYLYEISRYYSIPSFLSKLSIVPVMSDLDFI